MSFPDTPLAVPQFTGGYIDAETLDAIITARLNALVPRVAQLGPIADGITPLRPDGSSTSGAARATISAQFLFKAGPILAVYANFTTGSDDIAVGGVGNITNTPIGRVDPAYRSALGFQQGLSGGPAGRMISTTIDSDGIIRICATTPGAIIPGGTGLSVSGPYLAG